MRSWSCIFVFLLPILSLIEDARSEPLRLTLIHTNDVHSRFEQVNAKGVTCTDEEAAKNKCFGGFARLYHKAEEIRKSHQNVVYLSGGDYYQGTVWYTLYKWEVVSHFVNKLKHTAMALGNHEFDDGVAGLVPFLSRATFPVVSANIDDSKEPSIQGQFKPSVVVEYEGRKVGIIGYTTEETMDISNPGKLFFNNVTKSVAEEARRLFEDEGIRIIIAVGHAGYEVDLKIAELPYIDLVVGGHTNTFLYNGSAPHTEIPEDEYPRLVRASDGRQVPVVQAFAYGKYMGLLNLTFNDAGDLVYWSGNPILLDSSVPQDPVMLSEVKHWHGKVVNRTKVEVGRTRVLLDGDRLRCRRGECSLGNLVADAMVLFNLKYANDDADSWADVSLGIVHSGSIRTSIDEKAGNGSVRMDDVLAVQPFGASIDTMTIRGKHLKQVFEYSVEGFDPDYFDPSGKWLQVSGFRIVYDISKPSGSRVHSIDVLCRKCRIPTYVPLDEEEIYKVAVPGYLVAGGTGYDVIKRNIIEHSTSGILDTDVLLEYFTGHRPVVQGIEGRIRFVSDAARTNKCNATKKEDTVLPRNGSAASASADSVLKKTETLISLEFSIEKNGTMALVNGRHIPHNGTESIVEELERLSEDLQSLQ